LIWLTLFRISVKGVFFLIKALQKCKNPSKFLPFSQGLAAHKRITRQPDLF